MNRSGTAAAALAGGLAFALCQWLVFVYAPEERVMGQAQKIFYFHLPLAWWGLVSFGVACAAGILHLVKRLPRHAQLADAAVEVGMVFCTLTLATGSIWARHSWGVWWTWDPRLTTALILWFIYAGYLALRSMPMPRARRASLCSAVAVAGFADVPLVFLSARLWRSIHPNVFAAQGGGLETEMAVTAAACVLAFGLVWLPLLIIRYRQTGQQERLDDVMLARMADEDAPTEENED